jgi:zinc transport system substrate-binding protein
MRFLSLALVMMIFASTALARATDSRVVTTIKPIHSLVAGVMGDTGKPALLVDGIASPHGYALKPSQRKMLHEANLVFLIDPHFESFLAKVLADLPGHVRVVKLAHAGGVTVLNHREGGAWEAHMHSAHTHTEADEHEHHHHDGEHSDAHAGHDDHQAHDESHSDLHLWLDPQNAVALTKAIARELGKVYPENQSIYQENAQVQTQRLEALDAELAALLAPVKDKPFIVFHDAYQYLERRYGLTAVGSITLEPEQKVSARRVREMRAKVEETNAVCVFQEPQFDDKIIAPVIEGTKVRRGTLDPEGGAYLAAGPDLYFTLMRNLAKNLKECLS